MIFMASKRPNWWNYVKKILQEYPELIKKKPEKLTHNEKRKIGAVNLAIAKNINEPNAEERIKIINLVYFKKTHAIYGAAQTIPCHENTAGHWQAEFIKWVADGLDLP